MRNMRRTGEQVARAGRRGHTLAALSFALLLCAAPAGAQPVVELAAQPGHVALGVASPEGAPLQLAPAVNLVLRCARPWELRVVAQGGFAPFAAGPEIPAGRLFCHLAGESTWWALSSAEPKLIAQGGPTLGQWRTLSLDLRLEPSWEDRAGSYRGALRIEVYVEGRCLAAQTVTISFDIAPAIALETSVARLDIGRVESEHTPAALGVPFEALASLTTNELIERVGVLASKALPGAFRAKVRSNAPWVVKARVARPFEVVESAASGPARQLPARRVSVRCGAGQFIPLSEEEPIVVASGGPTGADGVEVSLDVRVELLLLDPAGPIEGAISFTAEAFQPSEG